MGFKSISTLKMVGSSWNLTSNIFLLSNIVIGGKRSGKSKICAQNAKIFTANLPFPLSNFSKGEKLYLKGKCYDWLETLYIYNKYLDLSFCAKFELFPRVFRYLAPNFRRPKSSLKIRKDFSNFTDIINLILTFF